MMQQIIPNVGTQSNNLLANWTSEVEESELRRLLRYKTKYYFSGGLPGVLPIQEFASLLQTMGTKIQDNVNSKDLINEIFNYGSSEGNPELRKILTKRLQKRDNITLDPENDYKNMIITNGSQQALYGVLDVIINPGDIVFTARPTYLGFVSSVEKLGGILVTLPSDEFGILPEFIEPAYKNITKTLGKAPKAIYVITYGDNPKGTSLPQNRVTELFNLAEQLDLLIIEDAAYKEIYFTEQRVDPIKALDTNNERVAYLSSSSKEVAPIRMGYSYIPEILRTELVKLKGFYDLCTSGLTQELLKTYYNGIIDTQLPQIRTEYKKRATAMHKAVNEFLPEPEITTKPQAGFFQWYEHKNQALDTKKILVETTKQEVMFVPGVAFYPKKGYTFAENKLIPVKTRPTNTMRLGYSLNTEQEIFEGIEILGKFL